MHNVQDPDAEKKLEASSTLTVLGKYRSEGGDSSFTAPVFQGVGEFRGGGVHASVDQHLRGGGVQKKRTPPENAKSISGAPPHSPKLRLRLWGAKGKERRFKKAQQGGINRFPFGVDRLPHKGRRPRKTQKTTLDDRGRSSWDGRRHRQRGT